MHSGKIKNSCPGMRNDELYLRYRLCKEHMTKTDYDLEKERKKTIPVTGRGGL
jgi:hypothetical protein